MKSQNHANNNTDFKGRQNNSSKGKFKPPDPKKQMHPEETLKDFNIEVKFKQKLVKNSISQVMSSQCSSVSNIVPNEDSRKMVEPDNIQSSIINKSSISPLKNTKIVEKTDNLVGSSPEQSPSQLFDNKQKHEACFSQTSVVKSSIMKAIKTSPRYKKSAQVAKIKNPGACRNLFEYVSNKQSMTEEEIVKYSIPMSAGFKTSSTIDPHVSLLSALPISSFKQSLSSSFPVPLVPSSSPLVASFSPSEASYVPLMSFSTPLVTFSSPIVSSSSNHTSKSNALNSLSNHPASMLSSSRQRLPIVSDTELAFHLRENNQHELYSVNYANAIIKNQLPSDGNLCKSIIPSGLEELMPSVIQHKEEIFHNLPPVAPLGPMHSRISRHVNLLVEERSGCELGSSTKLTQNQISRRHGLIMVPSVHSLPTLTPCESPAFTDKDDPVLKGSGTVYPMNRRGAGPMNPHTSRAEDNHLFPSQPWDPITNLNLQEKAILKILFEENRLDVPVEFLSVEGDMKAVEEESSTTNPTKKRFLSRYRNQSGIPARDQKESCDPETLHSLIETSKVLLSSNSIHINLTKEQEQNFILSMLKIIKETNS